MTQIVNKAPSATTQDPVEAIKAAGIKMPPCPQVLLDLQQVLQDPDSGNQVVTRLIGRDIKLAAAVFKTANSAGFARRRKFNTLDQAVAVIGRKAIGNIVKAAALRLSLGGPDPRLDGFWTRAMDIAMLCSTVAEIAPNSRLITPDDAFTAGLFHDCGVAVLIQRFRGYCDAFADRKKPPPEIPEQDSIIRISHCAVGELIAREWSLPEFVYETIRCHHLPLEMVPKAGVPATATLLMSAHIANVKAKLPDTAWPEHCLAVIAALGLAEDAVEEFEGEVWDSFEMLH
jgi:HD-like signal output (HDOD) protein